MQFAMSRASIARFLLSTFFGSAHDTQERANAVLSLFQLVLKQMRIKCVEISAEINQSIQSVLQRCLQQFFVRQFVHFLIPSTLSYVCYVLRFRWRLHAMLLAIYVLLHDFLWSLRPNNRCA